MIAQKLRALYGLKYDPFSPAVPVADLWRRPGLDSFLLRIEHLARDGGFALLTGDSGMGKSKELQLVDAHLRQLGDVVVGRMERPQSTLGDFYRELGELFGVNLSPVNRYGGFKDLRARWQNHTRSTLLRPVLLVDEAQEAHTSCLTELRLLSSACFDSESLLTIVLCGDARLPDRFRRVDLLPLGSRIRARRTLTPLSPDELSTYLEHLLDHAGAPALMTEELKQSLVDHAAGNPRLLTVMGGELLAAAVERKRSQLDDQLFLELYARPPQARRRHTGAQA